MHKNLGAVHKFGETHGYKFEGAPMVKIKNFIIASKNLGWAHATLPRGLQYSLPTAILLYILILT